MSLRIYDIIDDTTVEGPGHRTCIFLQGCLKHCYKCNSPQTWPLEDGSKVTIRQLADRILNNKKIEGVTFSGGEPLLQASNLYKLAKILKKNNLSIVLFTGYSYELIKKVNNASWNNLISLTDILITGEFIYLERTTDKLWVGSSNQEHHFLTDRYNDVKNNMKKYKNKIEIRFKKDGTLIVNGMADNEEIQKLFKDLI